MTVPINLTVPQLQIKIPVMVPWTSRRFYRLPGGFTCTSYIYMSLRKEGLRWLFLFSKVSKGKWRLPSGKYFGQCYFASMQDRPVEKPGTLKFRGSWLDLLFATWYSHYDFCFFLLTQWILLFRLAFYSTQNCLLGSVRVGKNLD